MNKITNNNDNQEEENLDRLRAFYLEIPLEVFLNRKAFLLKQAKNLRKRDESRAT